MCAQPAAMISTADRELCNKETVICGLITISISVNFAHSISAINARTKRCYLRRLWNERNRLGGSGNVFELLSGIRLFEKRSCNLTESLN